MSISFNRVPSALRTPGVFTEIDSSQAVSGLGIIQFKVLLLGQKLAAGTAPALSAVRISSAAEADLLFGRGSMLARMAEAALKANGVSETWAMPIDDAAGAAAAAGSITYAGAATAAGTIALYVAGKAVPVAAANGATANALATATAAAINADTSLPVTAAVDGVALSKVNLTARNKGLVANDIDVRLGYYGESMPAGVTATIVAMTGGTANPDITAALAALGDEQYHSIAMPYTDTANLTALETELASRFGPTREIEGQAFAAARGTLSTLGALGNSRNSQHLTIVSAHLEPMTPSVKAAETAALAAYFASIDPARPLQTVPYVHCLPAEQGDRFTQDERNILLFDGIATTHTNAGGVMQIERLITTYKTNASGGTDTAYLDVETLFTLMTIRHDWRDTLRRKYPRHKLADDGTRFGPGQAVVTPNVIKAEAVAKFREWEEAGLVENFDQFKADLIVERNASDPNRLDVLLPPDIINGLRVIGTQIQFRL